MAVGKCKITPDVIDGLVVVMNGEKPSYYDNRDRNVHFTDVPGSGWMARLDSRFLHHGGVSGSGNWEH